MNFIEVGKSYRTREKNTVEIREYREEVDDNNVPTSVYFGTFSHVIKGSENLKLPPNNIARFNNKGVWLARLGDMQPEASCHDLVEEVKKG